MLRQAITSSSQRCVMSDEDGVVVRHITQGVQLRWGSRA